MSATTKIEWADALVARFWSYVDVRGPNECWPWKAALTKSGYAQFRMGPIKVRANRAAYELTHGPLQPGQIARHKCDYRACCNPGHLLPGTHKQNAEDRVERGRSGRLPGARNPQAKLTDAQVVALRARAAAGETYRDIGADLGLHYNTVGRIVRHERWA